MDEKVKNQPQNQGLQIPSRQNTQISAAQRQAAVNLQRQKIEQIYAGRTNHSTPQTTPLAQPIMSTNSVQNVDAPTRAQNPVRPQGSQRVVSPIQHIGKPAVEYKPEQQARNSHGKQERQAHNGQWQRYHAAWQNYYQKYYETYYTAALNQQKKAVANIQPEVVEELTEEQKRVRALAQLKKDISKKALDRTSKLRRSRHFIPIFSAIAVVLTFLFLQYNRLIFAGVEAYVSPGNATAEETIQTPNSTVAVSGDPRLVIPKINVSVPVIYGISNDQASQLKAMENGVAHFAIPGANSVPGQVGNTVISGHSSNDLFDGGDYKFIFAQLEKMEEGDTIYANYNGVRYGYVVRHKEVVMPNEVSKVIKNDGKSWLTLITCTPLGTAEKRLLVFAEQVSPSPSTNKAADESSTSAVSTSETFELPRNSKTFFEKLFSWDWS